VTPWRKSSYSADTGQTDCVELARLSATAVGVRDSKNPEGGYLALSPEAFGRLVRGIKRAS
jgi:hypothetical protein